MNSAANKKDKKNKKQIDIAGSIWLTAVLLLILVVASLALLGTMLKSWPGGEKNVIALFPDDPADKNVYEVYHVPAEFKPDFQIGGGDGEGGSVDPDDPLYQSKNDVDLFMNKYLNDKGEVTVESFNGDKVVAPGTEKSYEFQLKNTGNVSLDYTLKLAGTFSFDKAELPILCRLRYGDEWIVGGENAWVSWKELGSYSDKRTVESGKYALYVFEWHWPFETDPELLESLNGALLDADLNDTSLGNAATDTKTKFELNINTLAQVTPGAVAVDPGTGNPVFDALFRRLGVEYVGVYVLLIIGAALGLLILFIIFIFKRKKKDEEDDEEPMPAPIVVPPPAPEAAPAPAVVPPAAPAVAPPPILTLDVRYKVSTNQTYINLDTLTEKYTDGETVTIDSLKARGIIKSRSERVKVLARGELLRKNLTVIADDFSREALVKIREAGCEPFKLVRRTAPDYKKKNGKN